MFRSAKHIYAQVIDDVSGKTLASPRSSRQGAAVEGEPKADKKAARQAGRRGDRQEVPRAKGIDKVVFDRNGYMYHGRVSALADGAREAGLKF